MKNLVVKSNRLNSVIQNLSLSEIRLIQLAIIDARESGKGLDSRTPLLIKASRYADAFDVSKKTAYEALSNAQASLFERRFSFLDDDDRKVTTHWLQRIKYYDDLQAVEVILTCDVVDEIKRLDGSEQFFTQYLLKQTADMSSHYSIRLYELLVQWRTAKKTPLFDLETFRKQMGIGENEYKAMGNLKRRVLDIAVEEINKQSDLTVCYEQEKQGRKITGFIFKIREKSSTKPPKEIPLRDINTPDIFHNMTDKQIDLFAHKLANDSNFGARNAEHGESMTDFVFRIKQQLTQPENQKKWIKDLNRLGYK